MTPLRRDPVIYQIYPRSFQDSDGDGIGDLRGIRDRVDYIADLGVDAVWLTPIFPSPQADYGYDVSDYTGVDPVYGTVEDVRDLVDALHARGVALLLDIVPCHTSIRHPWFRERRDWYVWAEGRAGGLPPNNWKSVFGGPAWSRDPDDPNGKWYLHQFYPEQPALNWRNAEVEGAIYEAMEFWFHLGIDGFRVDAIDRLYVDEQLRDAPPARERFPLRLNDEIGALDDRYVSNLPETHDAMRRLREHFPDAYFVGEIYRPTRDLRPYLRYVDCAINFELLQSPLDPARIRQIAEEGVAAGNMAWALSNHDSPRVASRWGPTNARQAARLLLTLPGTAIIYAGDEIGMENGPQPDRRFDRYGRDPYRSPMRWSRTGGFATGRPWLPLSDTATCNVDEQLNDSRSMLSEHRRLIAERRRLDPTFHMLPSAGNEIAYMRGRQVVRVTLTPSAERTARSRKPKAMRRATRARSEAQGAGWNRQR